MKVILLATILTLAFNADAQYYYKDIIGAKETSDLIQNYKNNKVRRVLVNSYDAQNTRIENFFLQQEFVPITSSLKTIARSDATVASVLTSYVDASGKVVKTIDSSDAIVNQTIYNYNPAGQLSKISVISADSSKTTNNEEHIWLYDNGKISKMLRIKNKIDTSIINIKLDEAGNVVEEQEVHKGKASIPVLYYYDSNNRLTDIVRYNMKAKRLLPEYLFEYSPSNQVIQRITVPPNSSEYIIWRSQYNDKGLKVKEAIYNKQKEITGKVEYQYSFGQ
jgi:hypothetical protein